MTKNQLSDGKVYILENQDAKLVKVGMSNHDVVSRRIDVNQIWLGTKGTCQGCGVRLHLKRLNNHRFIPTHGTCVGGNSFPLEKDSTLAKAILEEMRVNNRLLVGSEKASNSRKINKLEERIKKFEALEKRIGVWKINTVYYIDQAEEVESLTHKFLSKFLKENMQFGEIFCCSVEEARSAIETVLEQLDLAGTAHKEIVNN